MKASCTGTKAVSSILLAAGLFFFSPIQGKAQCPVDPLFTYQKSCDSANHITFINQTDTLSGGLVDYYEWDFGDGNASFEVNPEHTYASTGFFVVSLTAYDTSGCSESYTWPVNVSPLPVANFTHSPDSACSTSSIFFNSGTSIGSGLSFQWNFGDGSNLTSTSTTVSHAYNAYNNASCDPYQNYNVRLIVTDFHGCKDTIYQTVTVKRRPQPSLSDLSGYNFSNCHNNPDPSNPNDTLTVLNLTPNMACLDSMTIQWGDGAISSGLQSGDFPLTHIYSQLGIFNLVFTTYGSNGCYASNIYTVANQANPNVGLSAIGQNTGCAPFEMVFKLEGYENNSSGTYYVWDFGDGTTVTWGYNQPFINDTITHLYAQSHCEFGLSAFTVSVTAYNECNSATMQYPSLTVFYPPEAGFENEPMGCVGIPVQFINTSMNGYGGNCDSTTNYVWYFGDGGVSGQIEPQHIYTQPGTYNVRLVASNSKCGFTDSIRSITITGVHPDFTFEPVCLGDTMLFTDLSYGYDSDWHVPSPSVPIVQWHWDFGDGDTSNLQNPGHVYATSGVFTVSLTATSNVGCDSTISYDVIVDEIIIDSTDYGNVTCHGYNNGWIAVYATSQVTPVLYTLLPSNISNNTGYFNNLAPGSYIVTLDDTVCTAVTDTIVITEPDEIVIDSLLITQPLCYGEFGQAQVFASGGNSLIYTLYPGVVSNTTGLFTNLGHGSYYVIVEDTANCPPDTSNVFDIIVPDELLIDSVVVDHITCHGMNDGIITIYASGGISSQPYTYRLTSGGSSWSNSSGVFSGLLAGWYHPSVEDVNGCLTVADSIEVIDPDPIVVDSLYVENISCYNANNGYIFVQASGGTGTLSYTLLPDSIVNQTGVFTSLAADIYSIRIEDLNGCILNIPGLTILNPDPIVIDSIDYANITCHYFDDGQITVYASGGTGLIFTLLPDNLQNITGIFTGLDEGSYTVSVSDSNNCPAVVGGPITISNPPLMQVDSIIAQDLSCPGANDGIVQAYASGGIDTIAYQYVLNPGTDSLYNSTGLFTGLAPGGYFVSVTDANGCTVYSDSVAVNSPYQLDLDSLVVMDITCHDADDGIIEVYMLGGTGTLTYTLFPDSIVNLTGLYHNLDEGTYYVEVLDVNGCIFTIPNLIINNPAPILIDSIAYGHITCNNFNDGWFRAYGSGGTNLNYTLYPDNIQNSTGLFTGLDAGMYYVIVNDTNGCPSMGSDTIEIINPTLLQVDSVLLSHLTCPGSNDGSIQTYASGGIDSLAYSFILNPATDSIVNQTGLFTGLLPGNYLVRVVDANGCIAERSALEILSPPPIVIDSLDFEDITCNNFNNGIIEIYATGGTGNLTYTLWPDSMVNSTGIFTNLTENIYYVVIEDENACSLTSPNIAINNPDAIIIDSLSYDHITCNNDDDGWIQIYAQGGVNLNYTLYPDNITNTSGYFDNLAEGTYQVGVSDDNSCPEVLSDTIIIVNPPLLVVDSLDVQQISCHDADDGSIQAYVSGGIDSVAYTYILNPGTDSIVNYTGYFGNLMGGNYRILVIDANGCTTQSSVVQIINPPALTLGFLDLEDVTCYNAANGHIVAQVSGGTGTLTYTLYPDSISNTSGIFSNLNGGNYWIRVTDVNTCTLDITNLVIFEPGPITIDSLNYENINCHDDNNGWIRAYASGGNTLAYTLYPDNITNATGLFSGLDAGQYFIYVSDDNSCPPAISDTITIVNPDAMSIDSMDVQHLSCPGSNDGSIQVYASGGIDTLAYTYTLNPGNIINNSGLFTGLAADIYTVLVTDVNGCSILSGNIPVHSPYQLVVDSLFLQDITCHNFNDGIIEVYMLGGTGTLTYTLLPDNVSNTTGIFHNLAGNTYTVQVEDINGCIISIPNLNIINPDAIVLDSLVYQHISCHDVNDGSIRVYAHGGVNLNYTLYPGAINNTNGSFLNLAGGFYWVEISDDNSCPAVSTDTIEIINPSELVVDSTLFQNLSCPGTNDGYIEVFASGGIDTLDYAYTLNPGMENITNYTGIFANLMPGDYTILIEDNNGCQAETDSIHILSPYQLDVDSVVTHDITCHNANDGTIEAYVTGGTGTLSYLLLPDSTVNANGIFTGLAGNTYSVEVTDDNGCTVSSSGWVIRDPGLITIDSVHVGQITCHNDNDGWIQVYASGGTGLIYHLYRDSLFIWNPYLSNTTGLFENLDARDYFVLVTDANGCSPDTAGPITIINPDELVIDSITSTNITCTGMDDGTIHAYASGGTVPYTYILLPDSLYNGTGLFTGLAAGAYNIRVIDDHGCIAEDGPVNIIDPNPITFDVTHTDLTCFGSDDGTITIYNVNGGTGGYEYSINNGSSWFATNYFENLIPGNYFIMVRDMNLCFTSSVMVTIDEPPLLQITSFNVTTPTCFGCSDGEIFANVTGGTPPYAHSWSNGMTGNPITGIPTGSYTDTVTDANGCTTYATINVGQPDSLMLSMSGQDILCHGEATGWASVSVTGGTTPYSFSWNRIPDPTVIGTNDTLSGITAGIYAVTVIDAFNVTSSDTIEITQPDTALYVSFNYSDTICYGDSDGWAKALVQGGTQPYYYQWSSGTGMYTDSIYNLIPGTYSLTVTDNNGCTLSDSIKIIENPMLLVSATVTPGTICGNGNAQLLATPTGGTSPYDYVWTPADSLNDPYVYNPVASPDVTTNYTVHITDQRGCTAMDMVTLNVLPTPIADFSYDNPCASNLVYFTNLSSANGGIIASYYWDFGDGSYSSQTNPVHYYDQVDSTYIVSLIVSNGNGCSDTATYPIYVNPYLGLSIVADTSCLGNPTNFSYSLTNPSAIIDSCEWDFGDGATSSLHNPSHTYTLPGIYNVFLTVYDHSGCVEMTNTLIRVYPDPIAGFNDSTSCQNNLTYFEDISQGGGVQVVSWFWDFGDGNTSTQQNPVHGYAVGGTYNVSLVITNANGCIDSIIKPVVVFNRPVAAFTSDSGCVGSVVHFTDLSYSYNGILNYWFWDFGDGQTSVAQNPVHIYNASGTYTVTLVVGTTMGCYDTTANFVPVYPLPEAIFMVDPVCAGTPAQFTDQSIPHSDSLVSWYWNFGDGYTSNQQHPVHTFPGSGNYNVLLRVTNSNGCTADTVVPMTVYPLPTADFTFSSIACQNDTTFFTDLSIPNSGTLVSWEWQFGDGATSTEQNPYHIYSGTGVYDVILTVTNSNGCVNSATQALLIHQQPLADFVYDTACVGQTTHFYDMSSTQVGQIIDWYWEFDDPMSGPLNTSTVQNPSHSFVLPGIYNVMMIVTNSNYCVDTVIKSVTITEPPIADFSFSTSCKNDTTWFYNESVATLSPITAWIWDFGDGTIETYYSQVDTVGHVYSQSGQYHVTLTVLDTNGCSDSETRMLTAYPLPTALFEIYQNCVNNTVHFTDYSNGAGAIITAWFWDFGDPSSGAANYSTLQNPTHTYAQPGFYDVYLHVTNANGCSNWIIQTIEVYPGPVADFSTDSVCLNTPTYFDNLSYAIGENIIAWHWDFGDGTQSTLQYPIHTYTAPGTYYVTLSVTTENGCTDQITKIVKVNHLPVADFEYSTPSCLGDTTYFTDLSYSIGSNIINTWFWDFGDGTTSTDQNPVHLYGTYGTYMVTLSVWDTNGCTNTIQKPVMIHQGPVAGFSYMANGCDTVQFTDQSSGMGTGIMSWFWDFGDPGSGWENYSTLQHPVHVYFGSGIYTVMLVVTDSGGCVDTVYHNLDLQKPAADFTYDNACVGTTTQFTDQSVSSPSPITYWHWDFGDGTTSVLQNPVHTYTTAGSYYVTLTVLNESGCEDMTTQTVTIHHNPVADFATNTPVCQGDTTYFTDLSYSIGSNIITSWLWEFGDGTTSTLQHPTHFYVNPGTYTVILTVGDTNGCQSTINKPVNVNAIPIAAFTYNGSSCDTVYFTDQSSGVNDPIVSWWWDFGDPSSGMSNYSTQPNPMHVYVNSGQYQVTLVVTDAGGCQDTVVQTLDLERPVAAFTHSSTCHGQPMQFINQSYSNGSPIASYLWDFGDGFTSTQQDPQHTYLTTGNYVVTLLVTSVNGCEDTEIQTVTVSEGPQADFDYTEPNCGGDTTYFYDLSMPGDGMIVSWQWDFDDGSTSSEQDPIHLYASAGTYYVTLTVSDTNGCTSTAYKDVYVNARPVAAFTYTTANCETVSFTDQSVGSGDPIVAWFWDFGDPASGWNNYSTVQNPDHVYASSGTYLVQLIVTDSHGCKDTIVQSLELYQPVADFSADTACYGEATQFTDLSYCTGSAITSWLWDFGDGLTSTVQHPQHTYASAGYYYVTLTVGSPNGCQSQVMKQVYVQYRPSADFSWTGVCEGAPTYFTDESTVPNNGIINNWLWDFGDGSTSTDPNPSHTYVSSGTYQVNLTVWATYGCSHSMSKTVTITDSPIADFSADIACQGSATQFTDLSMAPGSVIIYWWWDFGDGHYATNVQHPQHVYPYAGTYTVTLIVGNLEGCEDTIQQDVTVRPLPLADFSADTACVNFPTQFTDLSLPSGTIINWSWNFGDPSSGAANYSGLQNPQHYYNTPGSYNVTLTVTDLYGCDHTVIKPILVTEGPYANFSFINNQCANAPVEFHDLSITPGGYITTWIWNYGDGTPADTIYYPSSPNTQHAYGTPGSYTVSLRVITSGGCYDVISKVLMVIPSPQALFTYTANCEDEEVVFTDHSIPNGGNPIQEWYWDFGDAASPFNTSTLQHPTHIFSSPGTYTVMEIVTNQSGCQDTMYQDVIIHPAPPVEFSSGPACLGEPTYFYMDSTIVNWAMTTSYLWDFGDGGFTNIPNPTHVYNTVGTFNVTLTISDTNGCENSVTHQVIVNPLPLANFDHSGPICLYDSVYFQDYSSTTYGYIVSWTWDFDDGSPTETIYFPNNPNLWHHFTQAGTYGVTLTVTNSDSCQHSFTREVTVNEGPIANFQWDSSCEDELVQFSDASYPNLPGSIIYWYWDFDDPGSGINNNSYEQNPMHLFTHGDSTYNVMLIIVTNDNCSDTIIKPVYISQTPAVDFGYDITCEDTLISFWPDSTVMNTQIIASWHWDFGDGGQGYNPYVQHLYTVPGNYTVTLTVTDIYGCTNAHSHEITILESPEALYTVTAPNCENNPVFFDDNSSTASGYIVRWHWAFGDGQDTTIYYPSNADVYHSYALLGTYGATLTVTTSDSCQSSMTQWITIDPAPMAYYDWDGACASELFAFTDLSVPNGGGQIIGWYWDFGDPASGISNTSNLQNPVHQFSAPGIYTVLLQITNINGCQDTITRTVEAVEGEPAEFLWDGTCMRDITQFMIDQTVTNPANVALYDWDFGDGTPHSNLMEPMHSYMNYGIYAVTLTITDLSGCEAVVSHEVEITPRPIAVFNYTASCIGHATQFEDLSYVITGEAITGWQWNFGDPSSPNNTSLEMNPTHVYAQAGIYRVTLAVTSESGCTDSTYLDIQVHEGPQGWFSYDVNACSNGQVSFADSSHSQYSGIVEWLWIFEPGHQSTVQAPQYIFPEQDTCYDVTLIVTDTRGCSDTVIRQVCIPEGLEVEILASQSCHKDPVTFRDTVLSPANTYLVSYHWDFGEPLQPGNTSGLPTPVHTYSQPGAYTVKLDAIDNHGCSVTTYTQVIVQPLPVAEFAWDVIPCDTLVSFYDISTGSGVPVSEWQWYFGDGTPVQTYTPPSPARIDHRFPGPGSYGVTLIVTNQNGCVDTLTREVTVNPCINSLFALEDTLVCERADLTFTDSTQNSPYIILWEWNWGDGSDTVYIHHTPTITHTYDDPGSYLVRLVIHGYVNNTYIYDTSYRQVDVQPSPLADFSCTNLCFGKEANFIDQSVSNTQISGWSWDFGDLATIVDTSSQQHPSYFYTEVGEYDVRMTITNRHGCTDSILKTMRVNPRPEAGFVTTPVCIGNKTYFTDQSNDQGGEIVSWRWNFGDPDTPADTSLTQNPEYRYQELGYYDVELQIATDMGCMDTVRQTVEVHPVPEAGFTVVDNWDDIQGNVLVNNQTFGAQEYEWHWGDGLISYETDPPIVHQYDMDGDYTITLVSWNEYGCQDSAMFEYEFVFKSLYVPNAFAPASGNPNVTKFQPRGIGLKSYLIQVYDTWGNIIWESTRLDDDGRPEEGWDGTYKGKLLPQDVYMWRVKAMFRDGTVWEGESVGNMSGLSREAQGTVTLVR